MTNYVKENISQTYHPERWQGKYEQVLPYIKTRFAKATKQLERDIASDYSAEISSIVSQLCHPAPQERGHPKERGTTNSNYSLERYVSEFDLLIKRIKIEKVKNE